MVRIRLVFEKTLLIGNLGSNEGSEHIYSSTSMARTPVACLPRLFRTHS